MMFRGRWGSNRAGMHACTYRELGACGAYCCQVGWGVDPPQLLIGRQPAAAAAAGAVAPPLNGRLQRRVTRRSMSMLFASTRRARIEPASRRTCQHPQRAHDCFQPGGALRMAVLCARSAGRAEAGAFGGHGSLVRWVCPLAVSCSPLSHALHCVFCNCNLPALGCTFACPFAPWSMQTTTPWRSGTPALSRACFVALETSRAALN